MVWGDLNQWPGGGELTEKIQFLQLKIDVLRLADIFENFVETILRVHMINFRLPNKTSSYNSKTW